MPRRAPRCNVVRPGAVFCAPPLFSACRGAAGRRASLLHKTPQSLTTPQLLSLAVATGRALPSSSGHRREAHERPVCQEPLPLPDEVRARAPRGLRDRLKRAADAERITMGEFVRRAVSERIETVSGGDDDPGRYAASGCPAGARVAELRGSDRGTDHGLGSAAMTEPRKNAEDNAPGKAVRAGQLGKAQGRAPQGDLGHRGTPRRRGRDAHAQGDRVGQERRHGRAAPVPGSHLPTAAGSARGVPRSQRSGQPSRCWRRPRRSLRRLQLAT